MSDQTNSTAPESEPKSKPERVISDEELYGGAFTPAAALRGEVSARSGTELEDALAEAALDPLAIAASSANIPVSLNSTQAEIEQAIRKNNQGSGILELAELNAPRTLEVSRPKLEVSPELLESKRKIRSERRDRAIARMSQLDLKILDLEQELEKAEIEESISGQRLFKASRRIKNDLKRYRNEYRVIQRTYQAAATKLETLIREIKKLEEDNLELFRLKQEAEDLHVALRAELLQPFISDARRAELLTRFRYANMNFLKLNSTWDTRERMLENRKQQFIMLGGKMRWLQ